MRVGIVHSRIRADERMLFEALAERDHEVVRVDVRDTSFAVDEPPAALAGCDVVLDRTIAMSRGLYVSRLLSQHGLTVINRPEVIATCGDKVATSLALEGAGVPTPRTEVAFTVETALEVIESFGYPCVLKPVIGSWGRLLAKVESRHAAEAILEHKATLGHYQHQVFYVQEYVPKPGGDVRVLTVDGEPVAAMTREADHWLTNAAKGAAVTERSIDDELERLAREASHAVGGGLLGVDLMETAEGYTVHEVNHGVEFRALDSAVETDIAGAIVEWLECDVAPLATTGP
ncbi:MAG: lysine biosynthesis protein LysX [Halobacteriota archaeon]